MSSFPKKYQLTIVFALLLACLLMYQNCGKKMAFSGPAAGGSPAITGGEQPGGEEPIPDPEGPTEEPGGGDPICDPLGGSGNGNIQSGLRATVFDWDEQLNNSNNDLKNHSMNYPAMGLPVSENVYVNSLGVTPREFNTGFWTQNGALEDQNGNMLVEWFGIDFKTKIKLSAAEEAGYYQFATLSDDGSIVWMDLPNDNVDGNVKVVDNDGTHSPRFRCSDKAIYLDQNTELPSEIVYYQGPANHISMVVLWRKVSAENISQAEAEAECSGAASTSYFFNNPVNGIYQATNNWNNLLGRGWKVLEPANYKLPDNQVNPCNTTN